MEGYKVGRRRLVSILYWTLLLGMAYLIKDAGQHPAAGRGQRAGDALGKGLTNALFVFYPATLLLQVLLKRLHLDADRDEP